MRPLFADDEIAVAVLPWLIVVSKSLKTSKIIYGK